MLRAAPVVDTGGWYLRGDVGVGAQNFKEFQHTQTESTFVWPASWRIDQKDMKSATFGVCGSNGSSSLENSAQASSAARGRM